MDTKDSNVESQKEKEDSKTNQDESFFEKNKKAIIIGSSALVLLLGLGAFFLFRNGDDESTELAETQEEEIHVSNSKSDEEVEFDYEVWPFPNRYFGLINLKPKIKKFEKELVKKIKALPESQKVIVIGHTSREFKKQKKYLEKGNKKLSEQRARRIVDYLIEKYDISEDKFEIIAKGSDELKVKNPTWSKQNRRVEIKSEE